MLRSAIVLCLAACGARSGLLVEEERMDAGSDAGRDGGRDAGPDPDCLDEPWRCDDGDLCTVDDCLPDGTCARAPLVCDDRDACTADACDPDVGCVFAAIDCDDASLCTIDACDRARGCTHDEIECDDADPCTADLCEPRVGCTFPPIDCRGCADGSRDAFLDVERYPRIAGCAGGFAMPGLSRVVSPTCARGAGDDGANRSGTGCTATDLCAPGWHVCLSAMDVAAHSPDGCRGASDGPPSSFFATRQTGPGCGHCSTGSDPSCSSDDCRAGCLQTSDTTNDIFGCGTLGDAPQASSCAPLDRFSNNVCTGLRSPWRCDGDPAGLRESDLVVKPGSDAGGVLCCID